MKALKRFFDFEEKGTSFKTEIIAGLTTFMTMAYIIFVQPAVLSQAGMDFGAVMMATYLSAAIATLVMGLYAGYPIGVASLPEWERTFSLSLQWCSVWVSHGKRL